jgi:Second Messenger Oligonucleotide or Dinucleotide Synthetase domain
VADIQKQFEKFHAVIRIDYEMSSELREKRDIVVGRIEKYLEDNGLPNCRQLLQGSYKMKTGVKPIEDLEFDIDIGLRFDFDEDAYKAKDVRGWIYDAVKDHTKRIEDRGPCVRVVYEAGYHLDLVTYAVWTDFIGVEQYRLAHKESGWRPAHPPKLLDYVLSHHKKLFADTEDNATKTDQFRRCVRALRRWNDFQIPYESDAKPTGLALVLLAILRNLSKSVFLDGRPDDRSSLAVFARSVANTLGRVQASKPTPEYEEMFGRLTNDDMSAFKTRMGILADALEFAGQTVDPVKACERLVEVFGEDFPVPEKEDTGKRTAAPAIVTSSSSA